MKLPDDVARCDGVGNDVEGWRDGCEFCLRRTADRKGAKNMILPPKIIVFECEYLILSPNEEKAEK